MELRDAARKAYEEARERALAEDPPEILPAWPELPLLMRWATARYKGRAQRQ
jgi:hypothetical protein